MSVRRCLSIVLCLGFVASFLPAEASAADFQAGAFAQPISPAKFPAPVNGSMKGNFANSIHDHMHARCLVLKSGETSIAFAIVDACAVPREISQEAKRIASQATGIPASHMLLSATHTHSAATMAALFQSDPDREYVATVAARIAEGIVQAHKNLEPAEVAWGQSDNPHQVFNRRWFMKEGKTYENPFGSLGDRVQMNPGYRSANVDRPSGPVDPAVAILAVRSAQDQRPLAVLANYSLHYVGGNPPISADYFAVFASELGKRLNAADARYEGKPPFVGIMSNGTSGNINNIDYSSEPAPRRMPGEQIQIVAESVADSAMTAYQSLEFRADVPLAALETDLQLGVRKASPDELKAAKQTLETTPKDPDGQFSDRKAIYARETVLLDAFPETVPVKLQVLRIGELSIAAIPCETFVEIGLELKKQSPLGQHFTISLANGYNGYLPTAQHHEWGGYETWRARSSYLEVGAADKIVAELSQMLQKLGAK